MIFPEERRINHNALEHVMTLFLRFPQEEIINQNVVYIIKKIIIVFFYVSTTF